VATTPSAAKLLDRYLAALEVPARPPGLDALAELTSAHLKRIPFENVSKLYYRHDPARRGLPDLARFLDGIERFHFGGTCYAVNFHLHQLLVHLGYQVTLCGADMATPNVHLVNIVSVGGRRYLVDGGYGAPFLQPLPLDAGTDREIAWGSHRYVLRPSDAGGRPRLDTYRDGVLTHGYVVNLAPRRIEEFAGVIADSFTDRATFMHAILVARYGPDSSATLRNLTLTTHVGHEWSIRELAGEDHLPDTIQAEFGIPRDVTRRALEGVTLTRQA
jgi:N-hydroxyarylamine O-acetyltransferase